MVGFPLPLNGAQRFRDWLAALVGGRPTINNLSTGPGVRTISTRVPLSVEGKNFSTVIEISGLTKTEAEDLLDWLEANGKPGWELTAAAGTGFGLRRS